MTLSCADLRWPELFQIIARANSKNMTAEEVETLSFAERCRHLNLNPVQYCSQALPVQGRNILYRDSTN